MSINIPLHENKCHFATRWLWAVGSNLVAQSLGLSTCEVG